MKLKFKFDNQCLEMRRFVKNGLFWIFCSWEADRAVDRFLKRFYSCDISDLKSQIIYIVKHKKTLILKLKLKIFKKYKYEYKVLFKPSWFLYYGNCVCLRDCKQTVFVVIMFVSGVNILHSSCRNKNKNVWSLFYD